MKFVDEDKARYEKECEELKTNGYFINSEGVCSTEMKGKRTMRERNILLGKVLVPKCLTNYQ